ncbi:MAG: hypothetical protein Q8O47_01525 [Candidatus Bathyarchaeota archaeon]|nr:hypothetical protein [Candidatus Bathyarchaeota archaeon]
MSQVYKRELVFVVTGVVAIVMMLDYFFGKNIPGLSGAGGITGQLQTWALIIQLMAIGLGAINLVQVHYRQISRKTSMAIYSAWFMIFFALLLLLGLYKLFTGVEPYPYTWIFANVYTSLGATLYAITGFYIFSAAYRAFRARNIDAAILLVGGIFVLLANAPIGAVIWQGFPLVGDWFNNVGQIPGMRAFTVVGALGLLAYGFRALIGKERGFYSEVQ